MDVSLTEEQKAAVEAPPAENLVSAAAGSGKTKVLSERIVKRIKDGATSIDRLLIVTFTRAAAAQMRERIYSALSKEYEATHSNIIKGQLSQVAAADICTIDSFCIDVVRRNFFRLGVPSDFMIADAGEMNILAEDVLTDVLEEAYETGGEDFIKLTESFGKGKSDAALRDAILEVYRFSASFAEPEKWLDDAVESHKRGSEKNERLRDMLLKEAEAKLGDVRRMLGKAADKARLMGIDSYVEVFDVECRRFDTLFGGFSPKETSKGIDAFAFEGFNGKKVPKELKDVKDELLTAHDDAKKAFNDAKSIYREAFDSACGTYGEVNALCQCVKRFRQLFLEEKISRHELEFSDCEYLAYRAVKESEEAADELRDKYDEIYIDEYQDTNPLQDELFLAVSRKSRGEPNLFIVGDVKQSIYRFRHSDPEVFSAKVRAFGQDGPQRKMILSKNFRSRKDVIDSVNSVFEGIMRADTGGVDYNGEHRLRYGANYIECSLDKSEIYLIDEEAGNEDELAREQKEAIVAAGRIKQMVTEGFPISENGRMRGAQYSDFAVLTRTIDKKADMITKVFDLMGVPAVCSADRDFYTSVEIRTVAAVLKTIDNPLCDIPLAAAMRSPFFFFDENEMIKIRLSDRECAFYQNVCDYALGDDILAEKCLKLINTITSWRERASVTDVESFISFILEQSGYYSFVGALAGGAARQENLRTLISIASDFEKTRYKGLYNFVRYLEKMMESGSGVTAAEETGDAVRIMTIHKSKGLEFPVVFVIGCASKFNDRDAQGNLLLSRRLGIGLVKVDSKKRIRYKTPEYHAVALNITAESRAEQMRLFYVAMTRAMEKLILIATVKEPENLTYEMKERAGERPDSYNIRRMNTYLEYVLLSAAVREDLWDITCVAELPKLIAPKKEITDEKCTKWQDDPRVTERLSYIYAYNNVMNIPSKMSVSEIKRMGEDDGAEQLYKYDRVRRMPSFKIGTGISGAARGTAYHKVLETVNPFTNDAAGEIAAMEAKGLLTKDEADAVDPRAIEAFLSSPVGDLMRKAQKLMREAPFTVMLDSGGIFDKAGEPILVQGVIDCLIMTEDGEIILVDYKTDSYNDPTELVEKYRKQLEMYELAVFSKFAQKCDKKYLYLFYNNDIIEV